jgi:hypothetical protein
MRGDEKMNEAERVRSDKNEVVQKLRTNFRAKLESPSFLLSILP